MAALPFAWQPGAGVHFASHSFISFLDIFFPSHAAIASGEQEAKTAVPGSITAALPLLSVLQAFSQHPAGGVLQHDWALALVIASPVRNNMIINTLFIRKHLVSE
jgi:hypothetical protein